MKLCHAILVVVVLTAVAGVVWAQTDSGQQPADSSQQPSDNSQQPSNAPTGAFGQEEPRPQVSPFPPLSGLDEAALEPGVSARSFLVPGIMVTEVADTNAGNTIHTGTNHFTGDTHALGSLALQRMWKRYEATVDYTGGASFYAGNSVLPNSQVHALDLVNRVLWRTGSLQVRDCFNYLPEGIFGGQYGGVGALGGSLGGGLCAGGPGRDFFGGAQLGSLGSAPRITNISAVDIQNSLSPRSAITLAGGYALSHFTTSNVGLIDSRQVTGQAGYNHALSRRNTVAISYAFQQFTFPDAGGGRFNDHVIQLLFGHQISGRMDFIIGAGPQFIHFAAPASGTPATSKISASGRATFRYKFKKAAMALSYDRYESPGSGLFAGATSDVAHASVTRPLSRRWDLMTDVGYSHNRRLQPNPFALLQTGSYDYAYAGARVTHSFTRTVDGFLMYQFDNMRLSNSVCLNANCGTLSDRHLMGVGFSWHPQPIRLD
jgi:hypothetical protein